MNPRNSKEQQVPSGRRYRASDFENEARHDVLCAPSHRVSLFLSTFPPSLFSPRLAKADEGEDKVERHSPLVKVAPRSMSPPCRFGRIRARKPGSFSCRENFIHVTFPFQILLQIFSINCHEIVIPYSTLHFCNMIFG